MEQKNELIVCAGLTKTYGSVKALDNLNLSLSGGRFVGLLGPNGSGKTTLIKLINGLIQPTSGSVLVDGQAPGVHTHSVVSYLPDRAYLNDWMRVCDLIDFYADFYADFDRVKANEMLSTLNIQPLNRLKTLSKGTKEKVQLILTMSRKAKLFLLDEPIAGVDPAARDYILNTILSNYSEDASVLLSTHLIADIERVLDEVIFLKNGVMTLHESVDTIREEHGKSVDMLFREVFAC
ncbi:MAG TPA: ABC transporter ATP-binding protein [Candidatus Agathobaculum merdipullorum]|nr:ABC transporter ATP-binding protein [Candidatus Agathobaculum merdipullorum]